MKKPSNRSINIYSLTPAGGDLVTEDWGSLHAIYQRASGETHVFNEAAAAFLCCISESPGTLDDIVWRVATALGGSEADASAEDFLAVAERLEELGLIALINANVSSS